MEFNVNKCKQLLIAYRKSSVIKHAYNMCQENAIFDNDSPLLVLLARKHLRFTAPTSDFFHIEETQHGRYLDAMIYNKFSFSQCIDDMSKKATNQLNLCRVAFTCVLKKIKTRHIV